MGCASSATLAAIPRRARGRSSTITSSSSPTRTAPRCTASAARFPIPGAATAASRSTAPRATAAAAERGPKLKFGNPYEQEHFDLIEAIRNNVAHNEGWYGATSSFTAVLGRMATYSGQR